MAERSPNSSTRPRPGPRPNPAAHGTTRRRVAQRTASKNPRSVVHRTKAQRYDVARSAAPASTLRWWALAVFAAMAVGIVMLLEAPVFEVNAVQISGAARTSEGSILEALDIDADQALLTYATTDGRDALAALPWIEAVSVTRQWPSSIRVVVRERAISAAIGRPSGAEWAVVASDGVVVEHRLTPPSGVPLIVATDDIMDASAVGAPATEVERALEIAGAVPLQLAPWITTWSVDAKGVVVAELVGSARANFGARDDHRTQYVSLASILDGAADLVCLDTIDLTIPDTPVLHRDAACLLASQELG